MKPAVHSGTIKKVLYGLAGFAGIGLVILIHETGHFLFAKLFNVTTPTFSLGFGPTLLEMPIGKTIFKICLLPFGGYVEMNPEQLADQAYIPKMLIIFGGIVFNLIFAYGVILCYVIRNKFSSTATIKSVTPYSPAANAGLQPADILLACNNHPLKNNLQLLATTLAGSYNQTIVLTVDRNGTAQEIPIFLNAEHPLLGNTTGWLGIELRKEPREKTSLGNLLRDGYQQCITTIQELKQAVSRIMLHKGYQHIIIGPLGIISMIGQSVAINPQLYWFILALLSLNIGLINMIPLPFFDGGKALLVTLEALIGTTIPTSLVGYLSTIFLILFSLFIANVTIADVQRLIKR